MRTVHDPREPVKLKRMRGRTRQTVEDIGGFGRRAGYSRAVRIGAYVAVSGTAALEAGEVVHPQDAYRQTLAALAKALAAAGECGAEREHVLRTRLLLAPGADWRAAARAHREVFAGVDPANTTFFVSGFIPEGVLVEVELDALLPDGRDDRAHTS